MKHEKKFIWYYLTLSIITGIFTIAALIRDGVNIISLFIFVCFGMSVIISHLYIIRVEVLG